MWIQKKTSHCSHSSKFSPMNANARIVQSYVLREIFGSTLLCTTVLTCILLYGNLSKYDEELFLSLSISPILFIELVSLMLPFALSLGLPFGFSLAVIFCVGRWSADREILAMQSLGIKSIVWMKPVFQAAFLVSLIGAVGSLQWVPIARKSFETSIETLLYQDLNKLARQGKNIEFPVSDHEHGNWLGDGLVSSNELAVTKAILNIGHVIDDEWKNIRVLLLSKDDQIQGILHAKSGFFDGTDKGFFDLNLFGVDYESVVPDRASRSSSNFVSFEKWKKPLRFKKRDQSTYAGSKYISIGEYIFQPSHNLSSYADSKAIIHQFNKYGSLAFSSASLAPILIFFGMIRGRQETYANLFLGVFVCLLFFLFCKILGEMMSHYGFGWWLGNVVTLICGIILVLKKEKK